LARFSRIALELVGKLQPSRSEVTVVWLRTDGHRIVQRPTGYARLGVPRAQAGGRNTTTEPVEALQPVLITVVCSFEFLGIAMELLILSMREFSACAGNAFCCFENLLDLDNDTSFLVSETIFFGPAPQGRANPRIQAISWEAKMRERE
jgi:hypothetical protein